MKFCQKTNLKKFQELLVSKLSCQTQEERGLGLDSRNEKRKDVNIIITFSK